MKPTHTTEAQEVNVITNNNDVEKIKFSAIPKEKRRIRDIDSDLDLADRIDSLHRAFANERGINERFREETATILIRILLQLQLQLQKGRPG
jgi:hypothetical protein